MFSVSSWVGLCYTYNPPSRIPYLAGENFKLMFDSIKTLQKIELVYFWVILSWMMMCIEDLMGIICIFMKRTNFGLLIS